MTSTILRLFVGVHFHRVPPKIGQSRLEPCIENCFFLGMIFINLKIIIKQYVP
jgi:hypothetical protein